MTDNKLAITLIIALFVSGVSGCATTLSGPIRPAQVLSVNNAVYDFEYAGPMHTIQYEFRFTNSGNTPINIRDLSVCCGCEAQLLTSPKGSIAPGLGSGIFVTCTMPPYDGPVEKVITLHTDAAGNESTELTIKGTVLRGTAIIPSSLLFGRVQKGESVEKQLRVLQLSSERLNISKFEANPALYRIEFKRFDEQNHSGYNVSVKFLGNVPAGTHSDVITIHTNSKRKPRIDVPIVVQVIE